MASLIPLKAIASPVTASTWKLASSAHSLANALRAPSVGKADFALYHEDATDGLELGDGFLRLGPAAKIRKLTALGDPQRSILRFLNNGAKINALRQVQDSLKSVASGVQRYASFCDLMRVDYFPPSAETVLRWVALFPQAKHSLNIPIASPKRVESLVYRIHG